MSTVKSRLFAMAGVMGLLASGVVGCAQPPTPAAGADAIQALARPAAAPAAVRACPASASAPTDGDIDGDGVADPVVNVVYRQADGGPAGSSSLEVRNSSAGNQSINPGDLKLAIAGVLVSDINGDGCADLVGTSYYKRSGAVWGTDEFFTILGSGSGLVTSSLKKYKGIYGNIALLTKPKALVVSTGSKVKLYPLSAKGVPGKGKVILKVRTGSEEEGSIDAVAASGNRLVLGMSSRKVGATRVAGMVYVLTFSGKGTKHHKLTLTQNTRGFATAAEYEDFFGYSVATRGNLVAISAPHETIGKAKETGMVHVARLTSGNKPKVKTVYNLSQNSPGIPGSNVGYNHWGSSVNLAAGIGCTKVSVVVGAAPDNRTTQTGTVTVAGLGRACGAVWSPTTAPFAGVVNTEGFGSREITVLPGTRGGPDTVLLSTGGDSMHNSQALRVSKDPAGTWKVEDLRALNGTEIFATWLGIVVRK